MIVAEKFIEEHGLCENSMDDTNLVNMISEELLKAINHGHGEKKKELNSTFDPYKTLIHSTGGGVVQQKGKNIFFIYCLLLFIIFLSFIFLFLFFIFFILFLFLFYIF